MLSSSHFRLCLGLAAAWAALLVCAAAAAGDLSSPRRSMETQLDLLAAGDVEGLRACFTDRLKSRINEKRVKKAQARLRELERKDLMADLKQKKSGKVAVKKSNGKTFNVLVEIGGKWYSDKQWLKRLRKSKKGKSGR